MHMSESIILLGGGGHAKVVYDALNAQGAKVVRVIDSKYPGDFFGIERVADYDSKLLPEAKMIIAIGDNHTRKRLFSSCQHDFFTARHLSAIIAKDVIVGTGSMILHGVIVQTGSQVGDHVILNTGCQVDHDCAIGNFAHIAPGSVLCGNVSVGEGALIGAGAVITPGRKIGAWSTVGAGAVVIHDVPDGATVVGVPAKSLTS
jgi:sugar O-acyltransferase (sialic acid O-acetyltransferase NeuD family)